jgi:hypothetical protein
VACFLPLRACFFFTKSLKLDMIRGCPGLLHHDFLRTARAARRI